MRIPAPSPRRGGGLVLAEGVVTEGPCVSPAPGCGLWIAINAATRSGAQGEALHEPCRMKRGGRPSPPAALCWGSCVPGRGLQRQQTGSWGDSGPGETGVWPLGRNGTRSRRGTRAPWRRSPASTAPPGDRTVCSGRGGSGPAEMLSPGFAAGPGSLGSWRRLPVASRLFCDAQ